MAMKFFSLYIEVKKQKSTAKSQQLSIPLNNFTVQIFPAHLVIVLVVCRSPISSFQNQYSQSWMWVITSIRTQDVQCRPPLLPLPLVLPPLLLPLSPDPADFSPNDWIQLLLSRRVSLSCHPHPLCMWLSFVQRIKFHEILVVQTLCYFRQRSAGYLQGLLLSLQEEESPPLQVIRGSRMPREFAI